VGTVSEQRQPLVGFRPARPAELERDATADVSATDKRRVFRLPLLRGRSATGATSRDERAELKEREKALKSVEAAKEDFFETPAGRARLSYKRGHRRSSRPAGSPARETTDPVDILNAVTVEGWKLVSGKFIHSEMRNGVVGCYLFKRSQKRRLPMNNPWQAPSTTD